MALRALVARLAALVGHKRKPSQSGTQMEGDVLRVFGYAQTTPSAAILSRAGFISNRQCRQASTTPPPETMVDLPSFRTSNRPSGRRTPTMLWGSQRQRRTG